MIEPGVRIIGNVQLGEGVSIASPCELMAKDSLIVLGPGCDVAAFVTISTADSSQRCLGLSEDIERREIHIGARCFIGQGAVILGGCDIGDGCVIGAGVVLKGAKVPPGSRVRAPRPTIEPGYYDERRLM